MFLGAVSPSAKEQGLVKPLLSVGPCAKHSRRKDKNENEAALCPLRESAHPWGPRAGRGAGLDPRESPLPSCCPSPYGEGLRGGSPARGLL